MNFARFTDIHSPQKIFETRSAFKQMFLCTPNAQFCTTNRKMYKTPSVLHYITHSYFCRAKTLMLQVITANLIGWKWTLFIVTIRRNVALAHSIQSVKERRIALSNKKTILSSFFFNFFFYIGINLLLFLPLFSLRSDLRCEIYWHSMKMNILFGLEIYFVAKVGLFQQSNDFEYK